MATSTRTVAAPRTHRRYARILWLTVRAYGADRIPTLGAALAFYTTIAVAPILVIVIALAGLLFEEGDARARVLGEIEHLVGRQVGEAVASVEPPATTPRSTVASVLGGGTLIFGALGVFRHLQDALNLIWRVKPGAALPWGIRLRRRLFSLATVVATGFLLLVSLVASAALSWLGARATAGFDQIPLLLQGVNQFLSLGVITFLFALIFKLLPDVKVSWRHVGMGALLTAVLFTLGKAVLGAYLGRAEVTSAYGAAGSLVALLLWCYYAAQIVFFGAEFTRLAAVTDEGRNLALAETMGSTPTAEPPARN